MCFANAVLQLLVHSSLFWRLFRELGDLKRQRGAEGPKTGSVTPLVDATVRFFEDFTIREKGPPPTQQSPQQAARGKPWKDEEKKEKNVVDSFEPAYMYGAMKEKRQLKHLLVRSRATLRYDINDLCWPNAYRTANSRMRKSFSASTSMRLTKSCLPYSLLLVVTRLLLHPE
jgi:hypothetical protein